MTEESKVGLVVLAVVNGRDDTDRLYHAVVCEWTWRDTSIKYSQTSTQSNRSLDLHLPQMPTTTPNPSHGSSLLSATPMTIRLHSVPESGRWRGHRREYARHDAAYQ